MRQEIINRYRDNQVTEMVAQIADSMARETLKQLAERLEHEFQIRADLLERGRDIWVLSSQPTFNRLYEQRQIVRASAVSYLRAAMLIRSEI